MLLKGSVRKLALTLGFLGAAALSGQESGPASDLTEATAAYQQGRTDEAKQKAESVLKAHPSQLSALVLMGAVLDSEQRYAEAEAYYQRALKIAPDAAQVLNNVANHYLASGNRERAHELYVRTIARDPRHPNANLQLAQMSVDAKEGRQALAYLSKLGDASPSDAGVLLLRARALALAGECPASGEILRKLANQPRGDASVHLDASFHFSVGMAEAECKLYDAAEKSFTRSLDADPRNFDILYNLGLAALRAGHADRAQRVLETALRERPEDADCLYALAQTLVKQPRLIDAAALLARARKQAPGRADIVLLLAQVSAKLEFYEDAAAAYDQYLKLKPADDPARRERGFVLALSNQSKSALRDLEWYVSKHPHDGMGFFELSIAQVFEDRPKALASLDHALLLDPNLFQARYSRALLNIEEERPAPAIEDLRLFLEQEPRNYQALAHLGQAYLALHRAREAAEVLQRAMDLAPDAPLVLVQYRRALVELGRAGEAAEILTRLKQSRSNPDDRRRRVGLIDYLSLSPNEQRARALANLQRNIAAGSSDPRLKIALGREMLSEGKIAEGVEIFRQLQMSSEPAAAANCGRVLLEFEQYEPARQMLETALGAAPSLSAARLDLAISLFHVRSPEIAMAELEKVPSADRKGDYYLLRAQILDAQGKVQEAVNALNLGMRAAPTRAGLYFQAAGFLIKHKQLREALDLLEQASRILPDERELLFAQVVTLELLFRTVDAGKLLARMQTRWPEWERPYLLSGILLEIQLKSAEARQTLETAIALGANTPEAYYYQALAIMHTAPNDLESAQDAIARAMALTSKDPYVYLLAGKISLARNQYAAAIDCLQKATNLQPTLIPAHYALRDAYQALGDEQRSNAELETIKHIAAENPPDDQSPFSMEDFLFTVRPPG